MWPSFWKGEYFATNTTIGWGIKAHYYWKNIADFEAHVRGPYARTFDITRDAAFKNSTVDNEARSYIYEPKEQRYMSEVNV